MAVNDVVFDKGGAVYNVLASGYSVTGNGTTDDRAALNTLANTTIPAAGGVVLFPPGTYRIGSAMTFPDNIELQFEKGAMLSIDSAVDVTIESAISAGPYHVFDGAGTATIGTGLVEFVYAEWWGAVAASSDGGAVDCTDALAAALASGKNVTLLDGLYGFTGGLQTGAIGQAVIGRGAWIDSTDPKGGTKLLKLAGSSVGLTVAGYFNQRIENLTLDGGGLAGHLLEDGGKLTQCRNLRFQLVGGTSYALHVYGNNMCTYDTLYFPDRVNDEEGLSYGHIFCESSLYSTFRNCTGGDTSGGNSLKIVDSTTLEFFSSIFEPTGSTPIIEISGTCEEISFDGLSLENLVTAPLIVVDATDADIRGIRFRRVRVLQQVNTSEPIFQFIGSLSKLLDTVVVDGFNFRDVHSDAGRPLVTLDGVQHVTFRDGLIYQENEFNFVDCSGGARSDGVEIDNVNTRSGSAGSNLFKTSALTVRNSSLTSSFVSGTDSPAVFINAGAIDCTDSSGDVTAIGTSVTADPNLMVALFTRDGDAGSSTRVSTVGLGMYSGSTQPALDTDGMTVIWERTSDSTTWLVSRGSAGTTKKVQLTYRPPASMALHSGRF